MTYYMSHLSMLVGIGNIINSCNSSLYVKPVCQMTRIVLERFLQSEICQGSTAPEGRSPPGVLAPHTERLLGVLLLLDSHHIFNLNV